MQAPLVRGGKAAYLARMGIRQNIESDYHAALAALAWQIDMGADEAIGDAPVSAYNFPDKAEWQQRAAPAPKAASIAPATSYAPPAQQQAAQTRATAESAIKAANLAANAANTRPELDAAAANFDMCEMRKGARGAVGAVGHTAADVMVICDPPSLDAEKQGQALPPDEADLAARIFAAIGLSLDSPDPKKALQLAPALPWPMRCATEDQAGVLAMMQPFALRRIALGNPRVVVVMGHLALNMLLGAQSLSRARGTWHICGGAKALVMLPPRSLLQNPNAKQDTWADALALKAALRS